MPCEYAHGMLRLPFLNANIALIPGSGQFSAPGTLRLFLQGRNRAGYTVASLPISPINYAATDAVRVTFPAAARTAATDFHYYCLSHSPTGNASDAIQLFEWRNYEFDQVTARSLGAVTLYRDDHVAVSGGGVPIVNSVSELPSGANVLPGMIRYLLSDGHYRFDPFAPSGEGAIERPGGEKWVRFGLNGAGNPAIGSVPTPFGTAGCAAPVQAISPSTIIAAPPYPAAHPPVKGTPIKLMWRNNSGSPLAAGETFRIDVFHGAQNKSNLYAQKLKLKIHGYVNLDDGFLDASGITVEQEFDWDGTRLSIVLEKDLPDGDALLLSVAPFFSKSQVGEVDGALISFLLSPWGQAGEPAHGLWEAFKDCVFPVGDRLRVLPGSGGEAIVLSGSALIKRYMFPTKSKRTVGGFLPGGTGQQLAIDGNGNCFSYPSSATLSNAEALRAKIGMEPGHSRASAWSNQITANGSILVTLAYPYGANGGIVRADYPTVGGKDGANFNPPFVQLYLLRVATNEILRINAPVSVVSGTTQTAVISSLSGSTVVSALPNPPHANFCLFDPPQVAIAVAAGGSLSGNFRVAAAYYFDGGVITSISHDPNEGCVRELPVDLVEAIAKLATPDFDVTNASPSAIAKLSPVVLSGSSSVVLANGSSLALSRVLGLAMSAIAPGTIGGVRRDGSISGTATEWDAIAGSNGGLVPGSFYFLNTSEAGKITSSPPNNGQLVKLGIAKSSTELILDISDPVGL